MRKVACPKCQESFASAHCPNDGTKLQTPDDLDEVLEYLTSQRDKAQSFVSSHAGKPDADDRLKKTVATRKDKVASLNRGIKHLQRIQDSEAYKLFLEEAPPADEEAAAPPAA